MFAPDHQPDSASIRRLKELAVEFSLFTHSGPVSSLEQAAKERGQTPEQIVRSILFRLASDEYAMALMPGPHQISWKTLRSYFKTSRLTLAASDEVLKITGFEIGAVNPFGLPRQMRVLIDQSIRHMETVSIGSGIRGTAIILRAQDLIESLPESEIVDLA